MDKYKINYYLGLLNNSDYKKALRVIPKALGISPPTLHNYRNLQIGDRQDIPHARVKILEVILGASEGLENYQIKAKALGDMKEE